jgi:hypothetical protein
MVDSSPIKPYEISNLWILVGIGYNYVVKTNKTPPMTGNGNHTTHKNGDFWGWFMALFTHIKPLTVDNG